MRYWVRFDVGKAFHWVCVLDEEGEEVLSRRAEATEEDLEAALSEIARLGGEHTFGIDLLGGPATLLEAVLLGRSKHEVVGASARRLLLRTPQNAVKAKFAESSTHSSE